jgi:predicted DNA-binding transcriptional regulator AlpA
MDSNMGRTPVSYLSAKQAASHLGVSVSFFRARVAGEVPLVDFAKPSARKRLPRWRVADLDKWATSRTAA